jgi:hypothetical protein
MSDSFTEKLYRLKSTCEERVNRIETIKLELENEKQHIQKLLNEKPIDLKVVSMKHQVSNLQLDIGKYRMELNKFE